MLNRPDLCHQFLEPFGQRVCCSPIHNNATLSLYGSELYILFLIIITFCAHKPIV